MTKADSLASDKYGFTFLANGEFIERYSLTRCPPPPFHFDNFRGTWNKTSDSVINIKVARLSGQDTFSIVIESLSSDTLKYTVKRDN